MNAHPTYMADALDLEQIVKSISFPRLGGTEHEKKARDIIKNELQDRGIMYHEEEFPASDFFMFRVNNVPYFLVGILACFTSILLLASINTTLSLVLSIILFIIGASIEGIIRAIKYPSIYCRFAKPCKSANLIIEGLEKVRKEKPGSRMTIHVMAHLDSKSETPSPHLLFPIIYVSVQLGSMVLGIHGFVYSLFSLFGLVLHSPALFIYGVVLGGFDMLRILTRYGEGESPGANDDAIGVALIVKLAERLKEKPLKAISVVPVLTGAEELGEVGCHQFLARHFPKLEEKRRQDDEQCKKEMDGNQFIILDGLCSRKIYYFKSRGLRFAKFSPLIVNTVKEMVDNGHSSTKDLEFIEMWMPPPANTDHSAVVRRGLPAAVFASPESVSHTVADVPGAIDFGAMACFLGFLEALLVEIDSKLLLD